MKLFVVFVAVFVARASAASAVGVAETRDAAFAGPAAINTRVELKGGAVSLRRRRGRRRRR